MGSHWEMSVTKRRVRTTSVSRPPSDSIAAWMISIARRVCAAAPTEKLPSAASPTVPVTVMTSPVRTARL